MTSDAKSPLEVVYFSDVLCVWAYGGQIRLDELRKQFGGRIAVSYRFLNVYGDVRRRIQDHAGKSADPAKTYARRMHGVADRFEHSKMHDDCFMAVTPRTSNQAHLILCGVRSLIVQGRLEDPDGELLSRLIQETRLAFFERGQDIGRVEVMFDLLKGCDLPRDAVEATLRDGTALAELSQDFMQCDKHKIAGSPTYMLDGGREKLFGNVGYRIIEANVSELLEADGGEQRGASWC